MTSYHYCVIQSMGMVYINLHLFMCSIILLSDIVSFSVFRFCETDLSEICISDFDAIGNRFLGCNFWLFLSPHRNRIHFCILTLYSANFWNSLFSSSRFIVDSMGLPTKTILCCPWTEIAPFWIFIYIALLP